MTDRGAQFTINSHLNNALNTIIKDCYMCAENVIMFREKYFVIEGNLQVRRVTSLIPAFYHNVCWFSLFMGCNMGC